MRTDGPWRRAARGANLLAADGTVAETIFAEMTALAARTGALNLGQGAPDEDGPAEVLEVARRSIVDGVNQYPPGRGRPELLAAIAEHQERFYGLRLDPGSEILVTAGATEALAAAILAFVEPGDEVVAFEPYYDAYGALVGLADGVLRPVPLRTDDLRPDHDALRAAVGERTRLILVNTPHNPTGRLLDTETLDLVVDLARRHDALIVTDEVYEHLVFEGSHTPLATRPGAFERTLSVSSGGKTFNTTGWKVGWMTGPAPLVTAALAVKQFLTYSGGAPFQPAIAAGLRLPDAFFARAAAELRARRDLLLDGLRAAGFAVSVPEAGYFVIADAAPLGHPDAVELCRRLPELAGVVGIPVSVFCHPEMAAETASLVRFAFCKPRDVIREASTRLAGMRSS